MTPLGMNLVLLAAGAGTGGAPTLPKLVVMPAIIDASAQGKLPKQFDEFVLTAAHATGTYAVIGPSDINAMLDYEKRKDAVGCDDTTCFAEIGGALGAQKLVSIQIAVVGGVWLITSKLVDTSRLTVEARSGDFVAGSEMALLKEVPRIIGKLFAGGGLAKLEKYQCGMTRRDECEEQCNAGHPGSCVVLGTMYNYGRYVQVDPSRAHDLYTRGCDGGDPRGCTGLGILYFNDKPVEAAALLERGCNGGIGVACSNLALLYQTGQGVNADPKRSRQLIEKGCEAGDGASCSQLGSLVRSAEPKRGVDLRLLGCERDGGSSACYELFKALVTPDKLWSPQQAVYPRAEALRLAEGVCERGGSHLCLDLARAYEEGKDLGKDLRKAEHYYGLACQGEVESTCSVYVRLALARDLRQGARDLDAACDQGGAAICFALGATYRSGVLLPKDPVRAIGLIDRACRAGVRYACEELARTQKEFPSQGGTVGLAVAADGADFRVALIVPGQPAAEAGVLAGDRIVRVDSKPVRGIMLSDVIALIRGGVGTRVKLTLERDGKQVVVFLQRRLPPGP